MISTEHQLKGLSEGGAPPKTRINSGAAVRGIFEKTLRAYEKRHARNAKVQGLVDGNPPYNQAALERNAQRYRANFNSGEAEAFLGTAEGAFYDLFAEVDRPADIKFDHPSPDSVPMGELASDLFRGLWQSNDRADWVIQLSIRNMVLFGIGPVTWEDEMDWRPTWVSADDILLPDRAPSNVADWDMVFIRKEFTVDQLFRFISDEETATKAGFNVQAIKDAIIRATQNVNKPFQSTNVWGEYQKWIRDNDIAIGEQSKKVRVARFLYREFGKDGNLGKVSEVWVDIHDDQDTMLFQGLELYEDFKSAVCAFFYDRGFGTAHSVRGLGVKMFNLLVTKDRLQNAGVDAAFARSAIMLQSLGTEAAGQQQLSISHVGPYSIVPSQYKPVEITTNAQIDAALAIGRDLGQTLSSNLGQYRARLDKQDGNPRTATEVSSDINKESRLVKTQISRFYQQLDEMFTEVFRRAVNPDIQPDTKNKWLKLASEFQKSCLKAGITREMLKTARVTARRSVGQGSAYLRMLVLNQIFDRLYQVLPEDGKINLTNDLIAAHAGRDQVARYNPVPDLRGKESRERWEAQVENDTLRNRGAVTITPYQNDVIHLQEHLAFASQAASSLEAGADPMDVWSVLDAVGKHSATHLQRLSTNGLREQEFKILEKQFNDMAQFANQLQAEIQKMQKQMQERAATAQRAQAVQQGIDPDTQLKWAEAEQKAKVNQYKAGAQIALKQQKQAADMAMKQQQAAAGLALKDATTAADIKRKAFKDIADIRQSEKAGEP